MTENGNVAAQIKQKLPLTRHLENIGAKLFGSGRNKKTNVCPLGNHGAKHWAVSVDTESQIFHCNDHNCGGSVIDWLMAERGKTLDDTIKSVGKELGIIEDEGQKTKNPAIVATYDYNDEKGELVYQVVRYEPKSFRQRQPDDKGGWIWNMDGLTRIPYRLAEVLGAGTVVVTEGEKDADNVHAIGFTATCNVGGAGKWLDAYSEFLAGKDVIVIPDNDEPGHKHAEAVIKSLDGKVNSLKLVKMPHPHKDASDFIRSFIDEATAATALKALIDKTPHTLKPLPVYSMAELEAQYAEFVNQLDTRTFSLSRFIPSLAEHVRRLMPGELVVVMSDTGVGKTAIQQCLARAAAPLPTLFFELELPSELMFERFVQMDNDETAESVEARYRLGALGAWRNFKNLNHIMVCGESGLTTIQIESFICRSELKGGMKPVVVLVDYIGLIRGVEARSRYEKLSETAEQMKIIAKRTRTIVILGTQVARPDKSKESLEPRLHDAKDSGSIENSAGLVIGAWRPDHRTLMLKILKNTKGKSGVVIECNFDGERMQITERTNRNYATHE